jgi:hypothetical protein
LTFPSYVRRERPEQPGHPSILVTYRFIAPVDDIYATLVVRLHHTTAFSSDQLWKSAADFTTQTGRRLGVLLTREAEGTSRLDAYLALDVDENSRVLFLRYVHDHLLRHAKDVARLRHYACENKKCAAKGRLFADRDMIDRALAPGGTGKVFCPARGKPIKLRDSVEEKFNSPEVKEEARKLADESQMAIDNESLRLILMGHASAIASEAGQVFRPFPNSDHGMDGEIEFKDDQGRASGKRVCLQFKSAAAHAGKQPHDEDETLQVSLRGDISWEPLAHGTMWVVRTPGGVIRWIDANDELWRRSRESARPSRSFFVASASTS